MVRSPPIEPVEDAGAADWLVAAAGRSPTFHTMVPDLFEAYARVFHPASLCGRDVRWGEVAAANGRTMHAAAEWGQLTGSWKLQEQEGLWDSDPFRGHTPEPQAMRLAALLAEHTSTPERCWFGVWEGWGGGPGGLMVFLPAGTPVAERLEIERDTREQAWAAWEPWESLVRRATTFEMPGRTMHLLGCPLAELASFYTEPLDFSRAQAHAPSIWWPEDRAWCVGSDVDLMTTYVGGDAATVAALAGDDELEALAIPAGQGVTWESDTVNPRVGPPD